jgi:hypothetical protein
MKKLDAKTPPKGAQYSVQNVNGRSVKVANSQLIKGSVADVKMHFAKTLDILKNR